jgi:hypothetical protein
MSEAVLVESTKKSFEAAQDPAQFKKALVQARRLKGQQQLAVLDSLFDAAARLKVDRQSGEPLGMAQEIDGSVTVTWATKTKRPDGSSVRTVQSAVLEPTDYGSGWRSRTKDVPNEIVEAVTAAAMADELKAPCARRRVYVR